MNTAYRPLYRAVYMLSTSKISTMSTTYRPLYRAVYNINKKRLKGIEVDSYRPLYRAVYAKYAASGTVGFVFLSPIISGCLQQYLVLLFTNSTTL